MIAVSLRNEYHLKQNISDSDLEQSFKIVEERTTAVLKLLIARKTVEQIANELKIPPEKVAWIEELFESESN